jgi:hypothetical protein
MGIGVERPRRCSWKPRFVVRITASCLPTAYGPPWRVFGSFQRAQPGMGTGSTIIKGWPDESREAAQLVIDTYGEPNEATESLLVWHRVGQWKRVVASRTFYAHDFPAPHIDAVESVIDYRVPPKAFTPLAQFDGSVVVERTAGEVSARCHVEQANLLALNLMHDIVTGAKDVERARAYYAEEILTARRKQPTPYMEKLRFTPGDASAVDSDQRVLSDEQLEAAVKAGEG